DRNGLKFYRPDGEIDKADETGILAALDLNTGTSIPSHQDSAIVPDALKDYAARCVSLLQPSALTGKRIGIYQHSSVGRDLMVRVLAALGAETIALARSDVFVPVDTEALRPEDIAFAAEACTKYRLDAFVSTDGDADRPLVADETGAFIRGDSLGLLTARFLHADAIVTPVTSNTAVELSGLFARVYRTKVGSPYVIEGMRLAGLDGYRRILGFEANGGVLLGSPVTLEEGKIKPLPTRDSMLPILAVLGMAARNGVPLSRLLEDLPARFTRSGRLEHIEPGRSGPFLQDLLEDIRRADFFASLGTIAQSDAIDGVRVVLAGGDVMHYRASGNAPELRCYAEAASEQRAEELLQWGLKHASEGLADPS
ncbi:MAG: phosphomannomutase, partial [Alphaproteobacteria bacterium]